MTKRTTVLVSLLVVGVAAIGSALLAASRPEPPQKTAANLGVAVQTVIAQRRQRALSVVASGTVSPARLLQLHPQVTGRLQWLYENLAPGTTVATGQLLYRIDAKDYQVAVQRAEAELRAANSALQLEHGSQRLAEQELEILRQSARRQPTANPLETPFDETLVLRQPQLEAARSRVDVAAANLAAARLNLSRTAYAAEFDAVILESSAELGQLVSPQMTLAQLAGTEQAWVRISVPVSALPYIELPRGASELGAEVVVRQQRGDDTVERRGHVLRLLSRLEESSRMAQLLVVVDDPFSHTATKEVPSQQRHAPLLINSYVQVEVQGTVRRQLVKVPRRAIREGNKIYVAVGEKLAIRELDVVWHAPKHVLVAQSVEDGEHLVVSPLAGAVEGMKIRPVEESPSGSTLGRVDVEAGAGD